MRNHFLPLVLACIAGATTLSAADPLLWYRRPAEKWGDAAITGPNVSASNGIIHVINQVIVPPSVVAALTS
jgi:hypothetical protein